MILEFVLDFGVNADLHVWFGDWYGVVGGYGFFVLAFIGGEMYVFCLGEDFGVFR
jgi:hypothetical protein